MMSLGEQFGVLMNVRASNLVERAAFPIAEEITEEMKRKTLNGEGFDDRYDTPYRPSYAKKRRSKGLQTERVELRYKSMRIERTTAPMNVQNGAEIGFVEGGKIFKYHQDGIRYSTGVRTRTIFPRNWQSVPNDIYQRFITLIVGVMNGK